MNDDRDPLIGELFAQPVAGTGTGTDSESFCDKVMADVQRSARRRRTLILGVELVALFAIWLLATPLQEAVESLLPWIMNSLVDLGDGPWAVVLDPVNNLASIAALVYLLGRSLLRRLML